MKVKKEVLSEATVGYQCDACGCEINDDGLRVLDMTGLGASAKHYECDLCENCFEKVTKFIVHVLGGIINEVSP